jgi:hypothetical protein
MPVTLLVAGRRVRVHDDRDFPVGRASGSESVMPVILLGGEHFYFVTSL